MIREIVTDIIFLKQKSVKATEDDLDIAQDLLETLKANADRCVGMAANMIGESKTIAAVLAGKDYLVLINPVITEKSGREYETEEGCLSLTGKRPVKRHSVVTVEYYDMKFRKKKRTFRNFDAQIVQHELDHFEGIII
ncbi:MAG: peptide deformylase [Oscillospiraceae bacterium]|nr:peptide deformylase [Oscillospiraceae bacterium]